MSKPQKHVFLLVVFLFLDLCTRVSGVPICAYGHTDCQILSLEELFDRVIQHSARMYGISSDLHGQLEKYFIPGKNDIGVVYSKCHTSNILTPNGKEPAQKLTHEELTEIVLQLLMAWRDPLFLLHESHQQKWNSFVSSSALELSNIAVELRRGVEKVLEKMRSLGKISDSMNIFTSPEDASPASGETMSDHQLLYCFRRDSDKVQNYLKILKCRIVPDDLC